MSKYFMYGGIAWVVFAFFAGVVLISTPKAKQDAPQNVRTTGVSSRTPSRPSEDTNTLDTRVSVKGTDGSDGTATTKVNVMKK